MLIFVVCVTLVIIYIMVIGLKYMARYSEEVMSKTKPKNSLKMNRKPRSNNQKNQNNQNKMIKFK